MAERACLLQQAAAVEAEAPCRDPEVAAVGRRELRSGAWAAEAVRLRATPRASVEVAEVAGEHLLEHLRPWQEEQEEVGGQMKEHLHRLRAQLAVAAGWR